MPMTWRLHLTPFQQDKLARVDDIEALLRTSLELAQRLGEGEMRDAANCIRQAIYRTGQAKVQLEAKWTTAEG